MKVNLKFIFIILISFIGISHSFAQTLGEIEKTADELFEKGEYLEAGKLYLKVISDRERIKDHTLNFKYGTCLLFYKGEKKQEAIAYLKRAVKKPSIDVRAHYYLGKAYHYNYQFDLAQTSYEKFQKDASVNDKKEFNVAADIKACINGKKLLSDVTDMIVIKKTQIKKENFYELYKLENIGGTILRYDEFQSKYDKKVAHIPLIHFPKGSPYIYFSSYGENGATGLDIYVVKKLPDGGWSLAQKVRGGVNTFQDEDFPYMSPDGRFLYFSSKGHNSMGGYDVFRSRYLSEENTYLAPSNMDFAISSPDDDIFYIVDSLDRNAYFTSARESELGKLTVYQARVEKIPMQMAVIKGEFINSIDNSNKDIEIIVSNYSNGKEIGTFNSDTRKGSFLITFPKSGKYTFIMTVNGEEVSHQAIINIPYLKEFRPLKMTISHLTDVGNENYIKVEQQFDERFENPTAIMAEIFKEISKLKPNAAKFDLDSLDRLGKVNEIFVEAGLDPYSTKSDVEKVIQDVVIDLEKIFDENDNNSTVSYHLAEEKLRASNDILEEIKELMTDVSNEKDVVKKNAILQSVYSKNEIAKKQKADAANYLELANQIDEENNLIQLELVNAKKVLLNVKSVNEDDRVAFGNIIYNEKVFFDEHVKKESRSTKSDQIIIAGSANIKEIAKINSELVRLNSEISRLEKENNNARINGEQAKKKKVKENFSRLIVENESEIEMLTNEIKSNKFKIDTFSEGEENSNLTSSAQEINDPAYAVKAYTTKIHPNDKAKIKSKLNESNSEYTNIENLLSTNNIKGQGVSLTGLNESRTDFTPSEWAVAIDEEIKAQERIMYKSTDKDEIDKIKGEIVRLTALKEVKTNNQDSENALAARKEIADDYETEAINLNQITNKNERIIAQNKLVEETIDKVKSEIVSLRAEVARDPSNSEASTKIKELELLNEELSTKIDNSVVDYSEVSTAVSLDKVYPSFNEKVEKITNSTLTDKEKAGRKVALNNKLLSNVDNEIKALTAYAATNPSNKSDIDERIIALKKVKSEKSDENIRLKVISQSNDVADTPNTDDIFKEFRNLKTEVYETNVMPNYESKRSIIDNSSSTEEVKASEDIKLNTELVSMINSEKEALKKYLSTEPANKKDVEKRIKNLEALKQIKLTENELNQNFIDKNPSSIDDKTLISELMPDYQKQQNVINNSFKSENEKQKDITALNNELKSIIDTKILSKEGSLASDINNEEIKNELNSLRQLKENLETKEGLTLSYLESVSESVSATDLLSTYNTKKETIEKSEDTEAQKAKKNIALNNRLISKINVEKEALNTYLKSDPANKKEIVKRIKNLDKLIVTATKENEINSSIIESTTDNILSISKITADFKSKEAENNKIENTNQKALAQNQLIEETLSIVETQVSDLESKLEKDPTNDLIPNQIEEFAEFKNDLNSKVNDSAVDLSGISGAVEIADILPTYFTEKESIDNSEADKTVKANDNIALNNKLISKINTELETLNSYLSTEPANKKDVEKRIKNLKQFKLTAIGENEVNQSIIESVNTTDAVISIAKITDDFELKEVENNKIENLNQKTLAQNQLIGETLSIVEAQVSALESKLEKDPTNDLIPNQIEEFAEFKNDLNSKIDHNVVDLSGVNGTVEIIDILPTYFTEKESIDNSEAIETVKANDNIALNNKLISKIDTELETLNSYLNTEPANKKEVEKRIKNLVKLKSGANKENEINQKTINDSNTEFPTVDIVSIDKVILDFDTKQSEINKIENVNQKTLAKNKLISETIIIVDAQVSALESELVNEPTNDLIPNQIEEFVQLKENLNSKIDKSVADLSILSATVEIGDLLPNYYSEKEFIDSSKGSEIVKATEKITLNGKLISKIDTELVALKNYLASNPANKSDIEERVKDLENLKFVADNENVSYQKVIDSEPQLLLGSISVGDLIPGFVERIESIDNSDETDSNKAIAKNKLNSDLITEIDLKMIELTNLKENNPKQLKEIDEQISRLTQLKINTLKEIEVIEDIIKSTSELQASSGTKSNSIADLSVDDFSTTEGKEAIEFLEDELIELNEIKADLAKLETEKENETSEKSINSIDKKITKNKLKQAQVENEIIEELANVNSRELSIKQAEVINSELNAKSSGLIDNDLLNADEQVKNAKNKLADAEGLRNVAGASKNPIEANEKYKAAMVLENEAKVEMDESITTYKTAIVVNELNSKSSILTSVDEGIENRTSTKLFDQANSIEKQANYYENRANVLRDSAETVKRKYKDAILIDVQSNENMANDLRTKAFDVKEKATDLKAQEDELLALTSTDKVAVFEGKEKDETLETDEYKAYFETKLAADEDMEKAMSLENEIIDLKIKSKRKIRMAVVIGGDVNSISNDEEIKKLQAEIDALTIEQEMYKENAIQKYNEAKTTLNASELSDEAKNNIIAFSNSNEQPKDKVLETYDPLLADFKAPEKLSTDIFRTTDVAIYSSVKDIPVDAVQPSGLVYKVQIGAFRNEPDKKYFDKFAPVSGQSLDNGITRFMVGYFTNFNPANTAKTKVRGMGDYKDAYVVAYYNGERVSISEARVIELNNGIPTTEFVESTVLTGVEKGTPTINNTNSENQNPRVDNDTVTDNKKTDNTTTDKTTEQVVNDTKKVIVMPITDAEKAKASYYTDSPNAAKANQVEIMKGLFFTVQIGVYSKPVPAAALFNTSPLNSQLTPTNKIRYTTGIFNSVNEASVRKAEVVGSGIVDAFVTAYFDGERITVANARGILKSKGQAVLFRNQLSSETSGTDNNVLDKNESTNSVVYEKGNIHYRILIGKFKKKVPRKYAAYLFNTEGVVFETETDLEKNIFLLTTKQNSISAVKEHLVELSELGIENMQLVSYHNTDIIDFNVAQSINDDKVPDNYITLDEPQGVDADFLLYQAEGIYYQVVIAEFEDVVPVGLATLIIELDPDTYEEETNDFGSVTYVSTKLESFVLANDQLNTYVAKGFKAARIIAMHKYNEISVEKAKAIKGK